MRTAPADATTKLATSFDERVLQAASTILGITNLHTDARYQLRLPVKKGGFGLRSMKQLADAAWVSAVAQAAQYCKRLLVGGRLSSAMAATIGQCVRRLNEGAGYVIFPEVPERFWGKYVEKPAEPGLQKETMTLIIEREHERFLRSEMVERDNTTRARWIGISAEHAGLWITTSPTHPLYRLTDEHFKQAARIRLGLTPHEHIRYCCCGVRFDHEPQHLLACRRLLDMNTVRHNQIRDALMKAASSLNTAVRREPLVDYKDGARADAAFYFRMQMAMIDVAVVHPLGNSYLAMASKPLGAAKKKEKDKERRYGDRVRHVRSLFYPFVMETTGGMGPRASEFIEKLVEDVRCGGAQSLVQGSVASHIRKISVFALCRGNGLVCEEGIRRSRASYDHY